MLHFTLYMTHDISLQQSPLSHMNRMAALRRLVGPSPSPSLSYTSLLPPTLLISCRGIASKLFVGGSFEKQHKDCFSYVYRAAALPLSWSIRSSSALQVSRLAFYTNDKGLSEAFSQYGQVIEAKVVMDRVSDRSKGFGFVTFASEDEAHKALTEMNGKALNGRVVFVDYAKPKTNFEGEMPIARGPPEPKADS